MPEPVPDEPVVSAPPDGLAILQALRDLLDRAERSYQEVQGEYRLVLVPEVGPATCESWPTLDALVERVKAVRSPDVQVFVFRGEQMGISRGGDYLIHAGGRVPLFTSPDVDEVDLHGYLGPASAVPPGVPFDPPAEVAVPDALDPV